MKAKKSLYEIGVSFTIKIVAKSKKDADKIAQKRLKKAILIMHAEAK